MANVLGTLFGDIADAIRGKTGETGTMKPAEFPEKISAIEVTGETEIVNGVDPYYQQLAEALMKRSAEYISGDATTMSLKGFVLSDGTTLASLQPYSFAGFSNVEGMEFSDVVLVQENAFAGNSKLKILDITTADETTLTSFFQNALDGCTSLEAVIIRDGASGLTSANINSIQEANDSFYIYVPSAYYDTVISNITDAFLPASRYRRLEEYPAIDNWNKTYTVEFYDGDTLVDTKTVGYGDAASTSYTKEGMDFLGWTPDPSFVTEDMKCYGQWVLSFAAASWDTVIEKAADGSAAAMWSVGDAKDLTLNYADGTSETVTVKIAGFNAGVAEDGNAFSMYFATTEPLKDSKPLFTGTLSKPLTTDQYAAMDLPLHLTNTVFPAMPAELQRAIRAKQNNHTYIPNMKLWLISGYELENPNGTAAKFTHMDGAFPTAASRILCKRGQTDPVEWWLGDTSYVSVRYYGRAYSTTGSKVRSTINGTGYYVVYEYPASGERGVVFGFGL